MKSFQSLFFDKRKNEESIIINDLLSLLSNSHIYSLVACNCLLVTIFFGMFCKYKNLFYLYAINLKYISMENRSVIKPGFSAFTAYFRFHSPAYARCSWLCGCNNLFIFSDETHAVHHEGRAARYGSHARPYGSHAGLYEGHAQLYGSHARPYEGYAGCYESHARRYEGRAAFDETHARCYGSRAGYRGAYAASEMTEYFLVFFGCPYINNNKQNVKHLNQN